MPELAPATSWRSDHSVDGRPLHFMLRAFLDGEGGAGAGSTGGGEARFFEPALPNGAPLLVGRDGTFDGPRGALLAELRAFGHALTPQEVVAMYRGAAPRFAARTAARAGRGGGGWRRRGGESGGGGGGSSTREEAMMSLLL